ncbi:MAG: hypothetical protein GQ574_27220 [Crocinitomix sp.]|nr:hypothetical protein [Crocinitomix sp.]
MKLNVNDVRYTSDKYDFLMLGSRAKSKAFSDNDFVASRTNEMAGLWGTFGFAKPKVVDAINPLNIISGGKAVFSETGNNKHKGLTSKMASKVLSQNMLISKKSEILERYLDLSAFEFENIPESIENMDDITFQFTLKLPKDHGALVYLEEYDASKAPNSDPEAWVRMVTPNREVNNDRTSLTYKFEYLFDKNTDFVDGVLKLVDKEVVTKTALKILTFKRGSNDLKSFLPTAIKQINEKFDLTDKIAQKVGDKKYEMWLYNPVRTEAHKGGSFVAVTNKMNKIDTSKKTLLLIHGTFSTTFKSFQEFTHSSRLKHNGESVSILQKIIKKGHYEQVIAFDHPTASYGVKDNVKKLISLFNGEQFAKPVGVITTSRGALLADHLISLQAGADLMHVDKMMTFAPAHGSDLIKTAEKTIDFLFTALKVIVKVPAGNFIVALAQFSAEAIVDLPGLQDMKTNSDRLKDIMNKPVRNPVIIQAMVGDYQKNMFKKYGVRWWKVPGNRIVAKAANVLDGIVRKAFDSQTDWVIGVPEQLSQLSNSAGAEVIYEAPYEFCCVHGKQFDKYHPRLPDGGPAGVFSKILTFFEEE